jgi:hypothetical protein
MFNLPLSCMSAAMGHQIGKSVGIVEDVETEDDGVGWGTYLRVKIRLDIAKPLARGRVLKMNGCLNSERLPKFCYHCGVIKHGVAGCLSRKGGIYHGDSSTQQFGCFLRVPPYNRSFPGKGGYGRSVYSGDSANSAEESSHHGETQILLLRRNVLLVVRDFRVIRLTVLESLLLRRNVLAVLRESREIKLMELFLLKG